MLREMRKIITKTFRRKYLLSLASSVYNEIMTKDICEKNVSEDKF